MDVVMVMRMVETLLGPWRVHLHRYHRAKGVLAKALFPRHQCRGHRTVGSLFVAAGLLHRHNGLWNLVTPK